MYKYTILFSSLSKRLFERGACRFPQIERVSRNKVSSSNEKSLSIVCNSPIDRFFPVFTTIFTAFSHRLSFLPFLHFEIWVADEIGVLRCMLDWVNGSDSKSWRRVWLGVQRRRKCQSRLELPWVCARFRMLSNCSMEFHLLLLHCLLSVFSVRFSFLRCEINLGWKILELGIHPVTPLTPIFSISSLFGRIKISLELSMTHNTFSHGAHLDCLLP